MATETLSGSIGLVEVRLKGEPGMIKAASRLLTLVLSSTLHMGLPRRGRGALHYFAYGHLLLEASESEGRPWRVPAGARIPVDVWLSTADIEKLQALVKRSNDRHLALGDDDEPLTSMAYLRAIIPLWLEEEYKREFGE